MAVHVGYALGFVVLVAPSLGCGGRTGLDLEPPVELTLDAGRDAGRDASPPPTDGGAPDAVARADAGARRDAGAGPDPIVDIDGDGLDDLVVGADLLNRVYTFRGDGRGFAPGQRISGPIFEFGFRLTVPGDLDSDGLDDAVIAGRAGRVFVHRGTPDGLAPRASADVTTDGADDIAELARIGDFDGDGTPDLFVGLRAACRAEVWSFADLLAIDRSVVWTDEPATVCHYLGGPLVGGGLDVDHDGHPDLVVALPSIGRVEILRGVGRGAERLGAPLEGEPMSGFGGDAELVGDLDADGWVELVVDEQQTRRVVVFWGGPEGFGWERSTAIDVAAVRRLGARLARAGDLDGDGLDDFATGEAGRVTIVFGSRERALTATAFGAEREDFGVPVAGLGDVDGDGRPELAVGASEDGLDDGTVFVLSVTPDRTAHELVRVSGTPRTGDATERFGISIAGR